ncbi:MAG: hypothetical protein J3K34DRAFT_524234 [Monoraphidium minutum]|nr:MAG: hypothetical protein J3K34DRAFT_524234 [Monoraphidium minutum]
MLRQCSVALVALALTTLSLKLVSCSLPPPQQLYRFLVLLPFGGVSPTMDVLAVASALAARGHHLTVVVPQDDVPFSKRAAQRHGGGEGAGLLEWAPYGMPFTIGSDEMRRTAAATLNRGPLALAKNVARMFVRPCELMLANATLVEGLKAGGYDAVMTFAFPGDDYDSCGCVVSHLLRRPLVLVNGNPLIKAPWSVPQFGSGLSPAELATLRGRAKNTMFFLGTRFMWRLMGTLGPGSLIAPARAALGLPKGPAALGGTCAPLLELCASTWHVEPPRPLGPPQVLIGPIAPRAAAGALEPASVAEFVASAPAGVAVVSYGSVPLFGSFLSRDDYFELTAAFADLAPLRVLWLLKRKNLPAVVAFEELEFGANTLAADWVDINDLLGHPNVKLFVTHGGIHSVNEAAFHGKPFIGVPFQFEQQANCLRLRALGMGEISAEAVPNRAKGATFTRQGMAGLIRKVLDTPSYAAAAARVGGAMRLQAALRPPIRLAVEEIELAMAHRDYGRWAPYAVVPARGGGGPDEL